MKKLISGILFVFVLLFGVSVLPAHAATQKNGIAELKYDEADTFKADVTGNGKKDQIETVISGKKKILKVNGKTIKSWNTDVDTPNISIISCNDKKSYLEINIENQKKYTVSCGLYKVKSGKLKAVLDYRKLVSKSLLGRNDFVTTGNFFDMIYATKVKGKSLYVRASLGTKSLGQIRITNLKLTYNKGKFTLAKTPGKISFSLHDSKTGKLLTKFAASKKLVLYQSAGSSKKSGVTIAKNTGFTPVNAVISNKNIYVKVKNSKGKTGWLKLGNSKFVKELAILVWG